MATYTNTDYKHRIAERKLIFTGKDGSPLKNINLEIKQTNHKFLFGAAGFNAIPYANNEFEGELKENIEKMFDKYFDIFNFSTLPFYWRFFEQQRGKPDTKRLLKGAEWLVSKGCAVKGHPLCWHTITAPWLLELSNEEILAAQLDRIQREVSNFKGLVDIWDVINEVVIMPIFDKDENGITRICKEYGRINTVKEMFSQAKKANPNAMLLINDFNTSENYAKLIEECLEADIPIDAIGVQSHMHQGYWGIEKTLEVVERFTRFKLPIHFTENTILSGHIMPADIEDLNDYQIKEWPSTPEGEERQAEEVISHYKTLFASPSIESITWWDFTDGQWLGAPSGLMTRDFRAKPAFYELRKLIKEEWWTKPVQLVTDDDGAVSVTGYLGEYEASFKGKVVKFNIDKDSEDLKVSI